MNIFGIYLRLDLTNKPKWFDELRRRYNASPILHITLTQPRFIEENQLESLKGTISEVLSRNKFAESEKNLVFEETVIKNEPNGNDIFLWFPKPDEAIKRLQKDLKEAFVGYSQYCDESEKEYENNFMPHLTVAEGVGLKEEAKGLLETGNVCEGRIIDFALAVVKGRTPSEIENPDNVTSFNLF